MRAVLLLAAMLLLAPPLAAAEFRGNAFVQDDATLKVAGRLVRLHGIYIPPTGQYCETRIRPVQCQSRAALALDFRIQGFVRCRETGAFADGSVAAICSVDGGSINAPRIDLGGWLIAEGWAVASPEAPFEYVTFERIARTRGLGVWGFPADRIILR
jgi:endonuclease YncB( thermonuclease family)